MPTPETSFSARFLRKIKKIDSDQIESFLAQVLREKAFLEVIFDSITEGIIVAEGTTKVVFINEAARSLFGVTAAEVDGKPLDKILRTRVLLQLMEEFASSMRPIRHPRGVYTHTGRAASMPSPSSPSRTRRDSPRTRCGSSATARRPVARRRRNSRSRTWSRSRRSPPGVAHEVKNPLNSLNIHTQLMQKAVRELSKKLGEDATLKRLEKSAGVVLEEIARVARVVDDFIRAVRPVRPNFQRASINRVIESLAELLGPDCQSRGIELTLSLDPEVPQLLMDSEQIQQALLNILKNAMEAIEKPEGRIGVRTILRSDHVLVEVEDNGSGIPEEDRLRIFEPYHSTKFNGTGLGLMVVFRIVKAHRGAIGLSSELGDGTVFSIALPLDERPVRMLEAEVNPPLDGLDSTR
jgi:two-component system, sporulation sensor kinase E